MTGASHPNFYNPEDYRRENSGSNYDLNIDNMIIQILFACKKLSYGDLKTKIEHLLSGKTIGLSTYNGHIKRLKEAKLRSLSLDNSELHTLCIRKLRINQDSNTV